LDWNCFPIKKTFYCRKEGLSPARALTGEAADFWGVSSS
jgi:hypothetical protein